MATPLEELTQTASLWVWGTDGGPPRRPGAYAWFSATVPEFIPKEELTIRDGLALLYTGIAPRASTSGGLDPNRTSLAPRISYHATGSADASALRLTLGCVLAQQLGLQLELHADGERFTWGPSGEARLSNWIQKQLRVSWVVHSRPWEVTDMAFRGLFLPLNLNITDPTPFHRALGDIKRRLERSALERDGRPASTR
jgi:hypothetical protein